MRNHVYICGQKKSNGIDQHVIKRECLEEIKLSLKKYRVAKETKNSSGR